MKRAELHKKLGEYLYLPDTGAVDVCLAANIATRKRLGNPVWLILIGVSSSGKSQIIRPLAMNDKFVHRVDDLTENTLISGQNTQNNSLLFNVGDKGILAISDLTTIFSKNGEARDSILGQLRMVYDGELTKYFGNQAPVSWRGQLGVIAGSTPSVYGHFERVADMGERFIYYRMKPSDPRKASQKALANTLYGKALDEELSVMFQEYLKGVVKGDKEPPVLEDWVKERILEISLFAAQMRTPVHLDYKTGNVDRVPFSEMPMRISLQFHSLARGFMAMNHAETGKWVLTEEDMQTIEWCAYSLANEERRACVKVICSYDFDEFNTTQDIANEVGLDTAVTRVHLQTLSAIGVLERRGESGELEWKLRDRSQYEIVQKIEGIEVAQDMSLENF